MLGHDVEAIDGLPVEHADRIKPLILPSPVLGEVAKRHPHLVPRAVPSGHLPIYRIAHAPRVVVRVVRIRIDQADVKRRPRSISPHPELDRIARRGQRGQILEGLKIEANEPVERHPSPAHAVAAHRWVCLVIVIDRAFAEVVGLDHVRAEEVFVEQQNPAGLARPQNPVAAARSAPTPPTAAHSDQNRTTRPTRAQTAQNRLGSPKWSTRCPRSSMCCRTTSYHKTRSLWSLLGLYTPNSPQNSGTPRSF